MINKTIFTKDFFPLYIFSSNYFHQSFKLSGMMSKIKRSKRVKKVGRSINQLTCSVSSIYEKVLLSWLAIVNPQDGNFLWVNKNSNLGNPTMNSQDFSITNDGDIKQEH